MGKTGLNIVYYEKLLTPKNRPHCSECGKGPLTPYWDSDFWDGHVHHKVFAGKYGYWGRGVCSKKCGRIKQERKMLERIAKESQDGQK
jgi:hypothetical protein